MTPTPVGMRCPECVAQRTKVNPGGATGNALRDSDAPATFILIALNALAFLAEIATGSGGVSGESGPVIRDFGLLGVAVSDGEWYRIVTGGFLHAGLLHIGFNMFALYFLGRLLEPGIGTPRFVALYFASLLAGAFGAIAMTDAGQVTVGASGAIFGIFGATFLIAGARGMRDVASQLGILLAINFVITLSVPRISVGGHLGGLVGGLICGLIIVAGERGMLGRRRTTIEIAGMVAVAAISAFGAISSAGSA
jgi:membrane associated rhomboid family serine protease